MTYNKSRYITNVIYASEGEFNIMSVTKRDIADHLGISRTAVSLVLNNSPNHTISEETRLKILKAAKELGYRDFAVTPKLGYILYNREPDDPRYMSDLKNIEDAASKQGYGLMFMNVGTTAEDFEKLQRALNNREMDGVIVSGDIDDQVIDVILRSEVPYYFLGGTERESLNVVLLDHRKLAYEATNRLISLGHQRIACFTGRLGLQLHKRGVEGYRQALEEAGIAYDQSLVQVSKEEDGYELCSRMEDLEIPYTAAFCANTIIQFGALQQLKERGIAVPGQISLIGSGMSELVKLSVPTLTTIYGESEKGMVVSMLIEGIARQRQPEITFIGSFEWYEGSTIAECRL